MSGLEGRSAPDMQKFPGPFSARHKYILSLSDPFFRSQRLHANLLLLQSSEIEKIYARLIVLQKPTTQQNQPIDEKIRLFSPGVIFFSM